MTKFVKNMQIGKQTDLILIDFSKAYDKVAHKTNFKIKLVWNSGQNTELCYHNWVKNFLDSRSQAVLLNRVNQ